jgi:hypothetical protein
MRDRLTKQATVSVFETVGRVCDVDKFMCDGSVNTRAIGLRLSKESNRLVDVFDL